MIATLLLVGGGLAVVVIMMVAAIMHGRPAPTARPASPVDPTGDAARAAIARVDRLLADDWDAQLALPGTRTPTCTCEWVGQMNLTTITSGAIVAYSTDCPNHHHLARNP